MRPITVLPGQRPAYVITRSRFYVFNPMHGAGRDRQHHPMPNRAPLKILIVDDHAALRRTVRHLFDASDIEILEAGSGEEAIVTFATKHPDWVIMDLRMPGIGGIKATEAIHHSNARARIVVISQFDEPEYREQARKAGAIEFVNKENMARLVEIIRHQTGHQP